MPDLVYQAWSFFGVTLSNRHGGEGLVIFHGSGFYITLNQFSLNTAALSQTIQPFF